MDNNFETEIEERSAGPQERGSGRFGQIGRSLKKIELRKPIVENPFIAVGIAAAAGAIVGLARPRPQPGRLTGALISAAGLIGFRLIREAAVRELGEYAKNYILDRNAQRPDMSSQTEGTGGGVRYSPAH